MPSTPIIYKNIIDSMKEVDEKMSIATQEINGDKGVNIKDYVDIDPIRINDNINLEASIFNLQKELKQTKVMMLEVDAYYVTVKNLYDTAVEVKNFVSTYTQTTGTRSLPIYNKAKSLLNNVITILNTKIESGYVFGGSETRFPPVLNKITSPNVVGKYVNAYYYRGDNYKKSISLNGDSLEYGITANDPSIQRLIGALTLMIDGFKNGGQTIDHMNDKKIITMLSNIEPDMERLYMRSANTFISLRKYEVDQEAKLEKIMQTYTSDSYNGTSDVKRQRGAVNMVEISNSVDTLKELFQANDAMYKKWLSIYNK